MRTRGWLVRAELTRANGSVVQEQLGKTTARENRDAGPEVEHCGLRDAALCNAS